MVPAATIGLRERKKAQTRRALQDTAVELFARQGFDGTTVEEIAAACDVSPRTFFRYFASKEDVLFALADERLRVLLDALASRPAGEPPLRAMREAALELVPDYTSDRDQLATRKRIVAETESLRSRGLERQLGWDDAVTEALRRRAPATGEDALELRLVATVASATLRAAIYTWLEDGGDLGAAINAAFDRVAAGLR